MNSRSSKHSPLLNRSLKTNLLKLLVGASVIAPALTQAVGFTQATVTDAGKRPLDIGIWYPSDAPSPTEPNTPFNRALAKDSAIRGTELKLVIISHGYGGWLGGHADTALALAEAGFVVAAPSHAGNTFRDMSASADQWIIDRPHQVSATIDYLQQAWPHRDHLLNEGVGVYGFSAGGLTALSLVGAVPDMALAEQHCERQPQEFGCRDQTLVPTLVAAGLHNLPADAWGRDTRISAAAIAAPGLAFAFDEAALTAVETPLQLWSALEDDRVPHASNALPLADALGARADTRWVEGAGHFAFMIQSCTEKLKKYEPDTWAFLCVDKPGFDRQQFHTEMNSELATFFRENL